MSVDASPASRPYYAITSSPLGHVLRKRSTGFRDTLLWEKRPLRLPIRIYTDGGSSSAVGELARSVAGRNVSFINLEEVQPWAPVVFRKAGPTIHHCSERTHAKRLSASCGMELVAETS